VPPAVGRLPPPLRGQVSQWVRDAFNDVTDITIINSWRKVGLPLPMVVAEVNEGEVNEGDVDDGDEDIQNADND
jgi:hypothetical protein